MKNSQIFIVWAFVFVVLISLVIVSEVEIVDIKATLNETTSEYHKTREQLNLATDALRASEVVVYELKNENNELKQQIEDMKGEIEGLQKEIDTYLYQEQFKRDIPLSLELQEYIHTMCQDLDLDYDLALAKISLESNFNIDARGYNKDDYGNIKSVDIGLMQINSNNLEWASELCGRELDIYSNVYDNIEAGLRIYKHYESYWASRGYVDRELDYRSLNSYNRGIRGFKSYMSDGNDYDDWIYGKLVMDRLNDLKGE